MRPTLRDRLLDATVAWSFDRSGFLRHQRGFDPRDLAVDLRGRRDVVTGAGAGLGLARAVRDRLEIPAELPPNLLRGLRRVCARAGLRQRLGGLRIAGGRGAALGHALPTLSDGVRMEAAVARRHRAADRAIEAQVARALADTAQRRSTCPPRSGPPGGQERLLDAFDTGALHSRGVASREELQSLRERLAESDPELLAAVADVDRTLIESWLQLSPWERAARSFDMADGIAELKLWRRVG